MTLWDRLLGREGKGSSSAETKSLVPNLDAASADFFSSDGGVTYEFDRLSPDVISRAFVAYWVISTRFRALKIAEAPLMVVKEDQKTGSEAWLPRHELAQPLDTPSPDYDMGELLERTSRYLDEGGSCLWVKNRDRVGRVARLTPFRRAEFHVTGSATRLFDTFTVTTAGGRETFPAEECCYFRDFTDAELWSTGKSRLDTAMAWLRLGETARLTIRDLLENAVWPSLVITPDKAFNPQGDDYKRYKADVQAYAQLGQKHKAMAFLGGGSVDQFAARVRDLVPGELLDRVETIVSAVQGVPAIVLQFHVGIQNSPWSQMEQARRMAYDDCIQPAWRKIEGVLTRQLLRPDDEDPTHFIRFDRTKIEALQVDRAKVAATAQAMGMQASLNERRVLMGLEPSTDPKADEIPELILGAGQSPPGGGAPTSSGGANPGGNANLGAPNGDNAANALKDLNALAEIEPVIEPVTLLSARTAAHVNGHSNGNGHGNGHGPLSSHS